MKNLISIIIFVLFSNFSFSQVNVGYAKAANLDEGRSFSTINEAIDRFISAMKSPLLGKIYLLRINQSFKNTGTKYGGREELTIPEIINILKWLKNHPEDMGKHGLSIYILVEGEWYTFQTLTYENGVWVDGKQTRRKAHKGEYFLECLDQKTASSWCLNLFPSVGVVQNKPAPDPEPEPTYEPDLEPEEEVVVIKKPKKKIVYIEEEEEEKEYIFIPKKSNREFTTLGDDYLEPSPWLLCEYCNKTIHKSWYMQHIRDHERSRRGYRDVSCNNNGLSLGEALLVSFLTPTPRYGHGHHHGGHRHNKHCGH